MSALIEVPVRHWFKVSCPPPLTDLYQHELGSWTEVGTAWHYKHWHTRAETVHVSDVCFSFLSRESLSLSFFSCKLSNLHPLQTMAFSTLICNSLSYTSLATSSAMRGGINCGAGDRGLSRKCMWVYASADGWVQTGFNIKPKALPLGCLSTAHSWSLICWSVFSSSFSDLDLKSLWPELSFLFALPFSTCPVPRNGDSLFCNKRDRTKSF